jgi:hypothetical protein
MLLPSSFTVSPFTFISFKRMEWFFELEVCPLHEVKMDRMLKNKSVVNFISVCLLFSAVGHRIADIGLVLDQEADFEALNPPFYQTAISGWHSCSISCPLVN